MVYVCSPCCHLAQDTEVPPDYRAAPFSCLIVSSLSVLFWPCNTTYFTLPAQHQTAGRQLAMEHRMEHIAAKEPAELKQMRISGLN